MSKISEFKSVIPGREEAAIKMFDFSRSSKNRTADTACSPNKVTDEFAPHAVTPAADFTSLINGRRPKPVR
jgi:hypothetical protein